MARDFSRRKSGLARVATSRDPLSQTVFNVRRSLSRVSWVDVGAVLLVWGNIIGLIAYPAIASHRPGGKITHHAAAAKQVVSYR